MRAFTNTLENKTSALKRAKAHRLADQYIKGTYWRDGKGCSVGCMMKPFVKDDRDWHVTAETVHGIPRVLTYLQDRIFEGLPNNKAMLWTERFYKAIPAGANLSVVVSQLMYWLMTDKDGIRKHAKPDGLKAIDKVAKLYKKRLSGKEPTLEEWRGARAAAHAADARYAYYERIADQLINLLEKAK